MDPQLALAMSEGAFNEQYDLVTTILEVVGTTAALELLGQIKNPVLQNDATEAVLYQLAQTDPGAALDALVELPFKREGNRTLLVAMETLAEKSPHDAIVRALQWPHVGNRNDALEAIAAQWADRDPAAAFAWAAGDAPESVREDLRNAVLRHWVKVDPIAAVEHISSVKSTNERNDLFATVVPALYLRDPTAALTFLDKHVQGRRRIDAIEQTVIRASFFSQSGTELLPLVDELVSAGRSPMTAYRSVISIYSANQPETALKWLNQRENLKDDDYQILHSQLVEGWSKGDLPGSKAYVGQLPDGPVRAGAIASVLSATMAGYSTESATDSEQQIAALEQTQRWAGHREVLLRL